MARLTIAESASLVLACQTLGIELPAAEDTDFDYDEIVVELAEYLGWRPSKVHRGLRELTGDVPREP